MTSSTKEAFESALAYVQSAPSEGAFKLSNQQKLLFYALYKQATEGANNTKAPSRLSVVNRAKWDAWKKLGNLSKQKAQARYINELEAIKSKAPKAKL